MDDKQNKQTIEGIVKVKNKEVQGRVIKWTIGGGEQWNREIKKDIGLRSVFKGEVNSRGRTVQVHTEHMEMSKY